MDRVYSVTQVNLYIKNIFANDYALNNIYVKGEVSNCKYHTSGHLYFTLKDESGQMSGVMFAGQRSGLKFRLSEGQSVIILGSVSVYERDGKYQLYAREILLDGFGVLFQRYEELKTKLDKEGFFLESHKKPIPPYPKKIGIVTSKTGAAIQDIVNIVSRRNPYVQLILFPALVQGAGAAETIVKGIEILDKMDLDTIIVGRGGGSIEDLWAFNEEIVAEAVYNCHTPIISAVGHETDTTITDFVSDLRAPTPSAAAELAVNDIREFFRKIVEYNGTLNYVLERKIAYTRSILEQKRLRLEHGSPLYQIRQKRQQLMEYEEKLDVFMKQKLTARRHRLELYIEKLDGLSPLSKLKKGYALVSDQEGNIINSIEGIGEDKLLTISVVDGDITAKVEKTAGRRRI